MKTRNIDNQPFPKQYLLHSFVTIVKLSFKKSFTLRFANVQSFNSFIPKNESLSSNMRNFTTPVKKMFNLSKSVKMMTNLAIQTL